MEGEPDLTDKIMEHQRREYMLLSKMAQREREMRRLCQQANEAVNSFEDTRKDSLRDAFVDPAVNIEIAMLRQRLKEKDQEIERLKEESRRSVFQPQSIQGQKLLRKCADLLEENAELGRQLGEEWVQTLRIQMAVERKKKQQLQQRIVQCNEHAELIDNENEKLQQRIASLGQQLKDTRDLTERHRKETEELRSGTLPGKRKKEGKEKGEKAPEDEGGAKRSKKDK
mmetsp:Transcript_80565/g.125523  ORF Transcript_80565/g.125523 Transcript_80565/m.125523 type:complete len:227 (-) Transcript_80565:53-733(-)